MILGYTMKTLYPCILLVCLIALQPAHAYLDPGTGSFLLQMLIAGVMGAMFTIKMYWTKVKFFFSGNLKESDKAEDQD